MSDTKPAPGSADFDVDGASKADYEKHVELLRRRQEVAALTPTPLVAVAGETSAPIAGLPEITKYNTVTKLPVSLPQRAWDALSDEDKTKFTEIESEVEKPAVATK